MRIEYTNRTASGMLYERQSSQPLVPRVGESVEIAQVSYVVNAVVWAPDEELVQVRLLEVAPAR